MGPIPVPCGAPKPFINRFKHTLSVFFTTIFHLDSSESRRHGLQHGPDAVPRARPLPGLTADLRVAEVCGAGAQSQQLAQHPGPAGPEPHGRQGRAGVQGEGAPAEQVHRAAQEDDRQDGKRWRT